MGADQSATQPVQSKKENDSLPSWGNVLIAGAGAIATAAAAYAALSSLYTEDAAKSDLRYPSNTNKPNEAGAITTEAAVSSFLNTEDAAKSDLRYPSNTTKPKKESYIGDEENMCKLCMDASIDSVLLECGHSMSCITCARRLYTCPICRRNVERAVHIYKS